MKKKTDFITITVRAFVTPDESIEGFDLGRPFHLNLPNNTTVGELIKKFFSKNGNQIGLTVINGEVSTKTAILSQGDKVDLYELLGGG